VFVLSVSFAMIPASAVTFIVHEKEKGLKHQQLISGMSLSAYWLTNLFFDLTRAYVISGSTILLIILFGLEKLANSDVYLVILLYPLAIIPFTYVSSVLFTSSSAAQNVTLFVHLALSTLACIGVFFLRINLTTEEVGDLLQLVLKFLPSYSLSNSLMYVTSKAVLNETREYSEAERILARNNDVELAARTNVTLENMDLANMGGDMLAMGAVAIASTLLLTFCLERQWTKPKCSPCCKNLCCKSRNGMISAQPEELGETHRKSLSAVEDDGEIGGLVVEKLKLSGADDVNREARRVESADFDGLITVKNLAKTYYLPHHKTRCCSSKRCQGRCCRRCCGNKDTDKDGVKKHSALNAEIDETQIIITGDGRPAIRAVEDTSFGLQAGECMALLGVNGAGKSTCFKSLTHEVKRTSGDVNVRGFDIERDFTKAAKHIGYCP
jgi:ABC-type multidrug transport system fused ATPase/permease subunit